MHRLIQLPSAVHSGQILLLLLLFLRHNLLYEAVTVDRVLGPLLVQLSHPKVLPQWCSVVQA